jgi:hypothetical protein
MSGAFEQALKGDYSVQTLSNDLHSIVQSLNLEKVGLVRRHTATGLTGSKVLQDERIGIFNCRASPGSEPGEC